MTALHTQAVDATIFAFRRNVVVAASAGTGKTHRLTALYLLLSLGLTSMGQPDEHTAAPAIGPDRIVATTFSRAAAREIAHRIEAALRHIAAAGTEAGHAFDSALRDRAHLLGISLSGAELKQRAAIALERWHAARIDTLHGLARQIIQNHALALGVPPGARVLDEDEAQALGDLAIDETLSQALEGGGDRADAARLLVSICAGVANTRRQIMRLFDRLDEEGVPPSGLARVDHSLEATAMRRELTRVALQCADSGSPPFRSIAAELVRMLACAEGHMAPAATELTVKLFSARMPVRSKRTAADEDLDTLRTSLPGSLSNAERGRRLAAFLREAPLLSAREARIVELLEEARRRVWAVRRRAGALGFGDLLRLARDGLRDQPEVQRAVREGIDALLVDEFQDTSRVQRDLVYLLRTSDGSMKRHGLFLVGDRKQSIYGFRGADVAVFCRVCAELAGAAAGAALSLPPELWSEHPVADFVALQESRRSDSRILDFVNAFAVRDFAGGRDPSTPVRSFEVSYGPAEQLIGTAATAAEGEVVFILDDGSCPEESDPMVREASGPTREALVAAAYIARRIRESTAMAYRDFAVLARRRSTLPLIELALSRLEVPYVVAGRALYDAPEVRDVAAALRLLLDPRDRLALATVLRGPMVALSDVALALLSVPGRGLTLSFARRGRAADAASLSSMDPADRARLDHFRRKLTDLRRTALRLTPAAAIRAVLAAFDFDRVLAALPRPEARIGNVDRLVAIAREHGGTLSGFVRWLDRRMRDDADEPEAAVFSPEDDAVRLTTIHGSKGLDFPVVVLVDLNASPRSEHAGLSLRSPEGGGPPALVVRHHSARPDPLALRTDSNTAEVHAPHEPVPIMTSALRAAIDETRARDEAERRRLTYVAITRARRELVLVGTPDKPRRASAFRTLADSLAAPEFAATVTRTEDACTLFAHPAARTPATAKLRELPSGPAPVRPASSPARTVSIATTPLSLFHDCPRRFRLRHLLGIEEPVPTGQLDLFGSPVPAVDPPASDPSSDDPEADPRAAGRAAHRVLELWPRTAWGKPTAVSAVVRKLVAEGLDAAASETASTAEAIARFLESPYARALSGGDCRMHREEQFLFTVDLPHSPGLAPRSLALRGAIDLMVERPGGVIDVIDYKRSRPRTDLSPYAFQLRAYALALFRRHPDYRIRAGVFFLGAPGEPIFLPGKNPDGTLDRQEHKQFELELARLAERLLVARWTDRFDGVAIDACRRLHCGFLRACHGEATGREHLYK